jgi:hypothetical protein
VDEIVSGKSSSSIRSTIGKQYSYGHDPDNSSDEEKKERQMNHL